MWIISVADFGLRRNQVSTCICVNTADYTILSKQWFDTFSVPVYIQRKGLDASMKSTKALMELVSRDFWAVQQQFLVVGFHLRESLRSLESNRLRGLCSRIRHPSRFILLNPAGTSPA